MTTSIASEAYAQWIEDLLQQGMEGSFVTFMFKQLPGSSAERQHHMLKIVERVYALRITRVIKHPRAAINRGRRPVWLAAPDLPVHKQHKQSLSDVSINGGFHVHAIVLEPLDRRVPACFHEFSWAESVLWHRRCPELAKIHVLPITHDVPTVVDYTFKQIERRIGSDGVLALPRTNDELRRGSPGIGRQSSLFSQARPQDRQSGTQNRR